MSPVSPVFHDEVTVSIGLSTNRQSTKYGLFPMWVKRIVGAIYLMN